MIDYWLAALTGMLCVLIIFATKSISIQRDPILREIFAYLMHWISKADSLIMNSIVPNLLHNLIIWTIILIALLGGVITSILP